MLNLLKTRIDANKVSIGTYWEVYAQEDGILAAVPIPTPASTKKGWIRVVPPGVEYTRALAEARKEHIDLIRSGKLTDEIDVKIRGTAVARAILKEWGNFTLGETEFHYSQEAALRILTDIEWTNFLGLIEAITEKRGALLHEEAKKAEGNSVAGSSGPSVSTAQPGEKTS